MVEVGDTVEVVREGDLQPGRPATDQVMEAQAAAPPPTTGETFVHSCCTYISPLNSTAF
jgi:hypothetical protein